MLRCGCGRRPWPRSPSVHTHRTGPTRPAPRAGPWARRLCRGAGALAYAQVGSLGWRALHPPAAASAFLRRHPQRHAWRGALHTRTHTARYFGSGQWGAKRVLRSRQVWVAMGGELSRRDCPQEASVPFLVFRASWPHAACDASSAAWLVRVVHLRVAQSKRLSSGGIGAIFGFSSILASCSMPTANSKQQMRVRDGRRERHVCVCARAPLLQHG